MALKIEYHINELEKYFRNNIHEILELTQKVHIDNEPVSYYTFRKFFLDIKSICRNQCIYDCYHKTLFAFRKFNFWTLKNNIILDASGNILSQYKLDENLFKLQLQKNVFSYKDTNIHIKKVKSLKYNIECKYGKNKVESLNNYYNPIVEDIIKSKGKDNILFVSYKKHVEKYQKELELSNVNTAWHGNILGKNDWRYCNKLYISSTYNVPDPIYILNYSFFGKKKITKNMLKVCVSDGDKVFKNEEIEYLKQNMILHNMYQTIKRINRDVNKNADIYIVIKNSHFENNIRYLLKDVNVLYDYDVNLPEPIYSSRKNNQLKNETAIENFFINKSGYLKVHKKEFCENTGIKSERLKEILYSNYIRKLCELYGVDLRLTFKRNSRYIYFKTYSTHIVRGSAIIHEA